MWERATVMFEGMDSGFVSGVGWMLIRLIESVILHPNMELRLALQQNLLRLQNTLELTDKTPVLLVCGGCGSKEGDSGRKNLGGGKQGRLLYVHLMPGPRRQKRTIVLCRW